MNYFMVEAGPSYHESLLHWIWEHRYYDYQRLQTTFGQKVEVHSAGKHNESDGPDFKAAEITIGNLRWYGDIEIHWKVADWEAHGHHRDSNFNNVILHVVFEEAQRNIFRSDQSLIPTLCLSSYLSSSLQTFLKQYLRQPQLPCAGHLSGLPHKVFRQQIDKAHKEYFEQKVDALMAFYDSAIPPSLAWKKMLTIALFDGLGISYNRIPMQKLATRLWDEIPACMSVDKLVWRALDISGLASTNYHSTAFDWKHKGCRPGNHPIPRIRQGVQCLWHIYHLPLAQCRTQDPALFWDELLDTVSTKPSIGRERSSILYGTVLLPALFVLGNLVFSDHLKKRASALWQDHQATLPKSLLKLLNSTSLPPELYRKKLGTVYQLRSYCRPKHCQRCLVFKNIISS